MTPVPCGHIMDSGRNCASPRLNRGRYCYWHNRLHTEHHFPGSANYDAPVLDSANAVALAVNHLYRGQSRGLVDAETARHLQTSLRLALQAFRLLDHPLPTEMVTDLACHLEQSLPTKPCHPERGQPALSAAEGTEPKDPATARATLNQPASSSAIADQFASAFSRLADSPAGATRLTREQERNVAQLVRRSAP